MNALRMKPARAPRSSSTGSRRRRGRGSCASAPGEEVALRGADDLDRGVVEVGEQVAVDDVADGAVVGVAVEEVDRTVEDRQQRVEVVYDDEDRDRAGGVQISEQLDDLVLVADVEVRERLVEEKESGSPTSAWAIATRCCWPPESWETRRLATSRAETDARAASTRRGRHRIALPRPQRVPVRPRVTRSRQRIASPISAV